MKKLLTFFLTALLAFSVGWAETTTVTASKITSSSATWTGSGNVTWNVSVNGGATDQNVTNGYAQVGTRTSPSTSITFSTSGISGTITSVVVDCAAYSGNATISATVDGNAFGAQGQSVPSWSNNSGGNVTFTGNASGAIVITMTNGSGGRAMYIKSITVTYVIPPTQVATIAAANDLAVNTNFEFTGNAVVTYQNGRYVWIRDDSGSGLIYRNSGETGAFNNGDVLDVNWSATRIEYNSNPQFGSPSGVASSSNSGPAAPFDKTSTGVTSANVNEYVSFSNVMLSWSTDIGSCYVTYGNKNVYFRNNYVNNISTGLTVTSGRTYNIEGIVYTQNH